MNSKLCRYEGSRISAANTPPRKRSGHALDFVYRMIFEWSARIDHTWKIMDVISRSAGMGMFLVRCTNS